MSGGSPRAAIPGREPEGTSRPLYLHIGFPKTATTFLQRRLFPRLPDVYFLHKPKSRALEGDAAATYGIIGRCFKKSARIWEGLGDEIFESLLSGSPPGTAVLLSDEDIATGSRRPLFLSTHLTALARKAKAWGLSPVRVIVTIRRQDHWLASHYAQISDRLRQASQEGFEAFVDEVLDPRRRYYSLGVVLEYGTLLHQLSSTVGAANLLALPYEMLREDPEAYMRHLLQFLGVEASSVEGLSDPSDVNRRSRAPDTWALRSPGALGARVLPLRPRRLLRRLGLPPGIPLRLPDLGRGDSIRLHAKLSEKILSVYADTNRTAAEMSGLDLDAYGYACGEYVPLGGSGNSHE